MLRGLATITLWTNDLAAATEWYAELLGMQPYFQRPGYAEFRVGDYQHELGLIDRRYAPAGGADSPQGVIAYWHVDDPAATLDRLLAMSAQPYEPLTERGPGFITASVVDPFGNILGIMHNAHYLAVLDAARPR